MERKAIKTADGLTLKFLIPYYAVKQGTALFLTPNQVQASEAARCASQTLFSNHELSIAKKVAKGLGKIEVEATTELLAKLDSKTKYPWSDVSGKGGNGIPKFIKKKKQARVALPLATLQPLTCP